MYSPGSLLLKIVHWSASPLAPPARCDQDAAVIRALLRTLFGIKRAVFGDARPQKAAPSADPRAQDPWMGAILESLGARYQLGEDKPDGAQVLRRTGRERFNPMMVFLRAAEHTVTGSYEVRGHGDDPAADARRVLDAQITPRLLRCGLTGTTDKTEEWGGLVLIRRYQGRCDEPGRAADAVRFMCQESDQVMDTATE